MCECIWNVGSCVLIYTHYIYVLFCVWHKLSVEYELFQFCLPINRKCTHVLGWALHLAHSMLCDQCWLNHPNGIWHLSRISNEHWFLSFTRVCVHASVCRTYGTLSLWLAFDERMATRPVTFDKKWSDLVAQYVFLNVQPLYIYNMLTDDGFCSTELFYVKPSVVLVRCAYSVGR